MALLRQPGEGVRRAATDDSIRRGEMSVDPNIRNGVVEALPEAAQIKDMTLRERVYDAWTLSLQTSGFKRIEDIPASGNPDTPPLKTGTQADHLRSVARIAVSIATELRDNLGVSGIDMDEVIAGGLCHDLGKSFEFDPQNQARWQSDPNKTGWPAVRHPVYGVHVAVMAGLPESIVHIAGAHSAEGENVRRSLVGEIVHHADRAFWRVAAKAGLLEA
jgi:putative nucleotidyltransferase with HDIG domain